jgi:hypothetical protein
MTTLLENWQEFEQNVIGTDFGWEQRVKAKFAFYNAIATVRDRLLERAAENNLADVLRTLSIEADELARAIAMDHKARV